MSEAAPVREFQPGPRWTPFHLLQWLDVQDTTNKWLEAQIIQVVSDGVFRIHYKGWSIKFDEDLDQANPEDLKRIAPLHTHTSSKRRQNLSSHLSLLELRRGMRLDIQDPTRKWYSGKILEMEVFSPAVTGPPPAWAEQKEEAKEEEKKEEKENEETESKDDSSEVDLSGDYAKGLMVFVTYDGWGPKSVISAQSS